MARCLTGSSLGVKFETYGWQDERGGDGPEVILGPAEADNDEELSRVSDGRRCRFQVRVEDGESWPGTRVPFGEERSNF